MNNKHIVTIFAVLSALLVLVAVGMTITASRSDGGRALGPGPEPQAPNDPNDWVGGDEDGGDRVACPMDARICPDGSSVGRVAPACEFAPCPGEESDDTDRDTGSSPGGDGMTAPDSFQVLVADEGISSGLEERKTQVVFDQAGYEALWAQIYASTDPKPELPAVDFKQNAMIGGFLGQQSSGGYVASLESVQEREDDILVTFKEVAPGPDCISISAITKPFVLVSVKNTGKRFVTEIVREVQNCQ
jgi:hypothetical protein